MNKNNLLLKSCKRFRQVSIFLKINTLNTKEINNKDSTLSQHQKHILQSHIRLNPKISENSISLNFQNNKLKCLMIFLLLHLIENLLKCSQISILIWKKKNILSKNTLQYFHLINLVISTGPSLIMKTIPELLELFALGS